MCTRDTVGRVTFVAAQFDDVTDYHSSRSQAKNFGIVCEGVGSLSAVRDSEGLHQHPWQELSVGYGVAVAVFTISV